MDFDDEELPVFQGEVIREEEEANHEDEGPSEPIQPVVIPETRKRPNWSKCIVLDAEGRGATKDTFRESKKLKIYSGYTTFMTKLIQAESSTFKEVVNHREWKNAMNEEYQSIMKMGYGRSYLGLKKSMW